MRAYLPTSRSWFAYAVVCRTSFGNRALRNLKVAMLLAEGATHVARYRVSGKVPQHRVRGLFRSVAGIARRIRMPEPLEHHHVVATVAVHGNLVLRNAQVLRQPGHARGLVGMSIRISNMVG